MKSDGLPVWEKIVNFDTAALGKNALRDFYHNAYLVNADRSLLPHS